MTITAYNVFGKNRTVKWTVKPKKHCSKWVVENWIADYFESRGLMPHLHSITFAGGDHRSIEEPIDPQEELKRIYGA